MNDRIHEVAANEEDREERGLAPRSGLPFRLHPFFLVGPGDRHECLFEIGLHFPILADASASGHQFGPSLLRTNFSTRLYQLKGVRSLGKGKFGLTQTEAVASEKPASAPKAPVSPEPAAVAS